MTDSKDQAQSLFLNALEIPTEGERAAYVAAQCGADPELRQEVEELLDHARRLGPFLEPGDEGVDGTIAHPISERPGAVIGPYKLLQQIGEGGMGVVFMAEQTRPVQRTVALKIIKPGMDTRQVIARFEAERQALAMMDHPNIARVLDVGATDAGRPYFVMDLVKGVPITDYCDHEHLPVRERLQLVSAVCHAVQHAHQKGIIHRDLKPSNVLVAEYDGRPVPKIIDFGVAKATAQQLTEKTMFTELGQLVGTVEYMSPEQARFNQLDVDTRSDIYSLGVLLYELLTGSTPFGRKRLNEAAFDEMLRIIREEEPPKPSTRLSSSDALPSIAASRGLEPLKLNRLVQGELDWIVMKALEKDRNRRYETASGLAADIQRHLNDEAVQACPPSVGYRFRKFARRNKAMLATVAMVVASVAGLSVSNIATKRERDAKTAALSQATTESARAKAVADLLQEMLGSADPERAKGSDYKVRELLDDFSAHVDDQLADQPEIEADIRTTIGRAYLTLGVADQARPHLERATELRGTIYGPDHEKMAASLVDYAWYLRDLQKYDEVESHAKQALEIYRQRGVTGGPVIQALWVLQHVLISSGRRQDAERVTQQAMAVARRSGKEFPEVASMLHRYAEMIIQEERFAEGEELARQAVDMHRRLNGDQHPQTAWGLQMLGRALQGQNKLPEAESAFRESFSTFRRYYPAGHGSIRGVLSDLMTVLQAGGDRPELEALVRAQLEESEAAARKTNRSLWLDRGAAHASLQEWDQAIDAYEQAIALVDKDDVTQREVIAGACGSLAAQADIHGNYKVAERAIQLAVTTLQATVAEHPTTGSLLKFGQNLWSLGCLRNYSARFEEGEELLLQALQVFEQGEAQFPDDALFPRWQAFSHRNIATSLAAQGKFADSIERSRKYVRIFSELAKDHPDDPYYLGHISYATRVLASRLRDAGNQQQSIAELRRAISLYKQAAVDFPDYKGAKFRTVQWECEAELARRLMETDGEYQEAAHTLNLPEFAPSGPFTCADAAIALTHCIAAVEQDRNLTEADRSAVTDALGLRVEQLWAAVIRAAPSELRNKNRLVWTLVINTSPGLGHIDTAVDLARQAVDEAPDRADCWNALGAALYRAGQYQTAIEALEKSLELQGENAFASFFLAMAECRIGRNDSAHDHYEKAVTSMISHRTEILDPRYHPDTYADAIMWMESRSLPNVELNRIRAEAAELLGITEPESPTRPQPVENEVPITDNPTPASPLNPKP